MNNDGITTLARFRQAYQSLRQSIEANESLAWYSSDTAAYATFKQLANEVASLLVRDDPLHPPTPAQAVAAHRQITANKWEGRWIAKPMSMPEA